MNKKPIPPKDNILFSLGKQLSYLQALDTQGLQDWLERALRGKPYPFVLGQAEVYERIIEIFPHATPELQQKIRGAIASLLRAWSGEFHELTYLDSLLYLAGQFRVIGAYEIILSWVYQQRFKDIFAYDYQKATGLDIHLSCLRTIGAQALLDDQKFLEVCLRDIEDEHHPYYFGICYRSLWQRDYLYLVNYFPKLIRLCMIGFYVFKNTFVPANKMWGNRIWDHLYDFLNPLDPFGKIFCLISLIKLFINDDSIFARLKPYLNDALTQISEDDYLSDLNNILTNPDINSSRLKSLERKLRSYTDDQTIVGEDHYGYPKAIHIFLLYSCGYSRNSSLAQPKWENIVQLLEEYKNIVDKFTDRNIAVFRTSFLHYTDNLSRYKGSDTELYLGG